jgi:beta-glucosidase
MAAPQIEGAAETDGKGESSWDRFALTPGKVLNGHRPLVACDHYHRYAEDFALMRRLGVKHYRLSLAWPRIFPTGEGAPNQAGLDFYRRLLASMAENGITPWVTMFHWDQPQRLEEAGGWRSRNIVGAFARYADTIVRAFPEVRNWITLNEISCFTRLSYGGGNKAPGVNEGDAVVNQTFHHALLCHGEGVRAVREYGAPDARVGLTDNPVVPIPLTETVADLTVARDVFVTENIRVLDPLYRGGYAETYLSSAGSAAPRVEKNDFDLISQPCDFLGLNLYAGRFVSAGKNGEVLTIKFPPRFPRADSPWLWLTPQTLYWGPRHVADIYREKSLYITENGCGYDDEPVVDGQCQDLHRREYLRSYLSELQRAIYDGVPIHGYMLWSFLDNFEWQDGYQRRFGICHVDFETQVRTPKLSAHWYASVMRENRLL